MNRQEHEPTREELLRAFAKTPAAFEDGVEDTLRRLKRSEEGHIMKRKLTLAPGLVLILVVLLAGIAVALYPGTIERFGAFYGEDFAKRLEGGDLAQSGASYTLGDVTYTVTDVVYEGGVLYGTVVMEPAEGANVVLIPEDTDVNSPFGVNTGYGEEAPEDAQSYKQVAQARGARMLLAKCVPNGYVLDGELLTGDCGYIDTATPEGAILSSFELYGWNGGIERAADYVIELSLSNWEVTPEGEWLREEPNNTWQKAAWRVTVEPTLVEQTPVPAPQAADVAGAEVLVPAGFDGALPVYAVAERDLRQVVQTLDFSNEDVAREDAQEYGTYYELTDGGRLSLESEGFVRWRADGDAQGDVIDLVSWEHFEADNGYCYGQAQPVKELEAFPLEEALAEVEALFEAWDLPPVQLMDVWTVDMDTALALKEAYDARNEARSPEPSRFDVSGMTKQDEGYALFYNGAVRGVPCSDEYLSMQAYVTDRGVEYLSLRAPYALGEAQGEAVQLIGAQEALAYAIQAAKNSWLPELAQPLETPLRIELVYTVRNRAQLWPAYNIYAVDGVKDGYVFSVTVSAQDGTVLNAPWM